MADLQFLGEMPADRDEYSWERLLERVRADYPDVYRAWFSKLEPGRMDGGVLRIQAPDADRALYLRDHCTQPFVQALMMLCGRMVAVEFIAPSPRDGTTAVAQSRPAFLEPVPLNIDYTFEQFVVGESNRLAHAACRAVCADPGNLYNPLFIHSGSGLGKTHLLQAICAELRRRRPELRLLYVSCETFVNDLIKAIEHGQRVEFAECARRADVLVIDDIQFLKNRESSQEEIFHTFNALYQSRRQIVLSADSPPTEIPTLEDRLVSRFNWGLVAQMEAPNRETRQAILHKKARLRGFEIPANVLDFIAEHIESNVRSLEGALTKLVLETQVEGRPMSVETAKEILADYVTRPTRPLQVGDIFEAVTSHFGIRLSELVGRKRSRSVSYPRQIGMYLA
ncbi:MAG: chromosomal replication initiator protein DnaA, partial [Planctomycetota bacterium]